MRSFCSIAATLMLAFLFFSGCKKDVEKPLSQSLIGKWKLDSTYMAVEVFGRDTLVGLPLQYGETLEFKSDLSYRDSVGTSGVTSGSWALSDSTLKLRSPAEQTVTIVQLDDIQLKIVLKSNTTTSIFYWYTRK